MTNNQKIINSLLFLIFNILFFPLINFYRILNENGGSEWLTAEWLINYDYGFVRRGGFGFLLDLVTNNINSKLTLLILILSFLYFYIVNSVLILYVSQKQNFISLILLFSPLFLFFPLYDIQGSFRKELLGFAIFLYLLKNFKIKSNNYLILFFYTVAIFSSEVNLLFYPFIVYFIFKNFEKNIFLKYFFIFSSINSIYIFFYLFFSNTFSEKFAKICNSLITSGLKNNICDGALYSSSLNLYETIQKYGYINLNFDSIFTHFVILIIALLPLIKSSLFKKNLNIFILIFVYFLLFFIISADWGRWLHIFIFCITCLYFIEPGKQNLKLNYFYKILIFIFYTQTWNVNHFTNNLNAFYNNLLNPNYELYYYLLNFVN